MSKNKLEKSQPENQTDSQNLPTDSLDDMIFKEELVSEIRSDFAERQKMRRPYELSWQLNMNFVMGNQYCAISGRGEIEQEEKYFFWQEKQVFNHIAPIVETRISRLSKVRPKPIVRPFSNSDSDINAARMSSKILESVHDKLSIDNILSQATMWSEVCGTSFYKVSWENSTQNILGKDLAYGDAKITVCPPFEIYPDSNVCQNIDDCNSIIHARVYSTNQIKKLWGVDVVGERVQVFSIDGTTGVGGLGYNSTVPSITQETKNDHAIVIERYTRPSEKHPLGRLEIVAGNILVYAGDLPYILSENTRDFPFAKQTAFEQAGCFWGSSVVERCIPVQRAYNAVKNRKHEFLNRLSMGILAVEDGSVDTENLEEEGLSPGKILIYRQGSNIPRIIDTGNVPLAFTYEENRLMEEFTAISGVSKFASQSSAPRDVTSGTALQQLTEQDDTRMAVTTDSIKTCIKKISKFVLRLYKQFVKTQRLAKICDSKGKVEVFYFKNSDINSDDIVFDTGNELADSPSARRSMVLQLLHSGVLLDKNGRLTDSTKTKVLSMLGFGNWEDAQDLNQLHMERASKENIDISAAEFLPIDNHDMHIEEHTRFVISGEADRMGKRTREKILQHILAHQTAKQQQTQAMLEMVK